MSRPRISKETIKEALAALDKAGGNQTHAARALGIPRSTLVARLFEAKTIRDTTPAKGGATADPYAAPVRAERAARKEAERKLAQAHKALEEERESARRWRDVKIPAPYKLNPTAKRKDDLRRWICPDSHGMYIDPRAEAAAIADCQSVDPDEVVLMGDHVDCAGFLAAHHLPWNSNQLAYSYEQDLAAAGRFLDRLQAAAPRARFHYMEGNHEGHVEWWCNRQALITAMDAEAMRERNAPEFLLKLKQRGITYYRRSVDYGLGVPGAMRLGNVAFVHDPGRRVAPQNQAKDWGLSLVYGHLHVAIGGVGRVALNGDLGAWCPGTLSVRQPLYLHTNMSQWTHGTSTEIVSGSGRFMHLQVPIVDGRSLLPLLLKA